MKEARKRGCEVWEGLTRTDKIISLIIWVIIILFLSFGAGGGIAFIIMVLTGKL